MEGLHSALRNAIQKSYVRVVVTATASASRISFLRKGGILKYRIYCASLKWDENAHFHAPENPPRRIRKINETPDNFRDHGGKKVADGTMTVTAVS